MRINCPFCGERGAEEFIYHGDATLMRPGGNAPMAAWVDYVFLRDNPAGVHRELWFHSAGCQSWLVVTRDLRSHAVLGAVPARDAAQDAAQEAALARDGGKEAA